MEDEHTSRGIDVMRAEYSDSDSQVRERLVHSVNAN